MVDHTGDFRKKTYRRFDNFQNLSNPVGITIYGRWADPLKIPGGNFCIITGFDPFPNFFCHGDLHRYSDCCSGFRAALKMT